MLMIYITANYRLGAEMSNEMRLILAMCETLNLNVEEIPLETHPEQRVHKDQFDYKVTKRRAGAFVKPTVEQVQAYITEKGYSFSAESFVDF